MNRTALQNFSIRDVLWLTVVAALAVAWWVERSRSASAPAAAPSALERYELLATGKDHDKLLLFDPHTGEVWERNNSKARWQPHTMSRAESR
jgi:hypothetical protein